jgi:hypothetical protein
MVNNLFLNLRDDQVTSFGDTDRVLAAKKLINEATREVVDGHRWSFTVRDDALLYFPPTLTDTDAVVFNDSTTGLLAIVPPPSMSPYTGSYRSKLMVTSDSSVGNTSYPISDIETAAYLPFTLKDKYQGALDAAADFTLYAHEMVLPTSVKQVLSVRNEEEPVRIEPVEKHIEFDTLVPRVTDTFHDRPYVVYVGGTLETTSLNSVGKVYQMGVMVWPPPDSGLTLKYSYVRRADTLSDETDVLQGVPDDIVDIIEWVAFQKALMGNMEDDPKRGTTLLTQNEYRIKQAQARDRPAVLRRRYMLPFGSGRSVGHPNARWETREISAP